MASVSSTDVVKTLVNTLGATTNKPATVKSILGEFDKILKANLAPDAKSEVSEEDLFAAVVRERVEALKGKDAADQFTEALNTEKSSLKSKDGFVPVEQATINALQKMVEAKQLTDDEGSQIYSEGFAASQLDDNKEQLFDGRGGPGDPTMAMATLDVALKQARGLIEKLASGDEELKLKALASAKANRKSGGSSTSAASSLGSSGSTTSGDFTAQGTVIDGPEGFLFKPVTNNSGKLAVLLGQNVTGNVASVIIKDSLNNIIETGKLQSAGIKETGREKYNFSKKGADYPKDITVEVKLSSGEVQRYKIPDPSKRYD